MNPEVFISYKSEEKAEADWVRKNLEAHGLSCWMAPESISGGSSYATEINKAIAQCRFFVLILSKKAMQSPHVTKEMTLACDSKIVLPFKIENCVLEGDYVYQLSNVQQYEAYENRNKAMEKMIADIRRAKRLPEIHIKILPGKNLKIGRKRNSFLKILAVLLIAALVIYSIQTAISYNLLMSAFNTIDTTLDGDETTASTGEESIPNETISPQLPIIPETIPTITETVTVPTTEPDITFPSDTVTLPKEELQTNDTKGNAAELTFDEKVTNTLKEKSVHWYKFYSATDVLIYRIGAEPLAEKTNLVFRFDVTLYDGLGLKIQSFSVRNTDGFQFLDIRLETGETYYLKVTTEYWSSSAEGGFALHVSPRESDTGLDEETATELSVGEKHIFTLNSTIPDVFLFAPEERDIYVITVYNVDVGCRVQILGKTTLDEHGNMFSLSVKNEDSGQCSIYSAYLGKKLYIQVFPYDNDPIANGTYVILIEKMYEDK